MSLSLDENIFKSITIICKRLLNKAQFDKTIIGEIIEDLDENNNFIIKYQDATFIAKATDASAVYGKGDLVYILVPGNDNSKVKLILSKVYKANETSSGGGGGGGGGDTISADPFLKIIVGEVD